MGTLKTLIFLNAYEDSLSSGSCSGGNQPSLQNFRWTRETTNVGIEKALSETFQIAPNASQSLFSGARTLTQDSTTAYSIALVPLNTSIYQLTNTGGTSPTFRTLRSIGSDATTQVTTSINGTVETFSAPGTYASFVGLVSGLTTSVTITSNNVGINGNSVILTGNGTSSVSALITAWNAANPSNSITLTAGNGAQIPALNAIIQLSGGTTAFNLNSVLPGDQVLIGTNFNQLNQGIFTIISVTPTSFSIVNSTGYIEGPITLGSQYANQIRIFSGNGVQVGDTLVINSGFSPVSWNSYQITQVLDNALQFSYTGVLPTQGPITTEIAIYSMAKTTVYIEADQNCEILLNGANSGPVLSPLVSNGQVYPALFLINSTIYNLSIVNNSITTANVTFLSTE